MPDNQRLEIRVPPTDLETFEGKVSLWLVSPGRKVRRGRRIVELAIGPAVIELTAPADGRIVEILIEEDESIEVDTLLAHFEPIPQKGE